LVTLVKDLFDLLDAVRGGNFVLCLAQGLERPEQKGRLSFSFGFRFGFRRPNSNGLKLLFDVTWSVV